MSRTRGNDSDDGERYGRRRDRSNAEPPTGGFGNSGFGSGRSDSWRINLENRGGEFGNGGFGSGRKPAGRSGFGSSKRSDHDKAGNHHFGGSGNARSGFGAKREDSDGESGFGNSGFGGGGQRSGLERGGGFQRGGGGGFRGSSFHRPDRRSDDRFGGDGRDGRRLGAKHNGAGGNSRWLANNQRRDAGRQLFGDGDGGQQRKNFRRHDDYSDDDGNGDRGRPRRDESPSKPVMQLFDPARVPRSGRYFEHDSRDGDSRGYRRDDGKLGGGGRSSYVQRQRMYDPRVSDRTAPKRLAPIGWRNQQFGDYGDGGRGDSKRSRDGGYRNQDYSVSNSLDNNIGQSDTGDVNGVWKHDKFEELEREQPESEQLMEPLSLDH